MYRFNWLNIVFLIALAASVASEKDQAAMDALVHVKYRDEFLCYGVMVTPVFVITSGSCASKKLALFVVIQPNSKNPVTMGVNRNHQESDPKDTMGYNTLAVLELDWIPHIDSIDTLPLESIYKENIDANDKITVLGHSGWDPKVLGTVELTVINEAECLKKGTPRGWGFAAVWYGPSMVCAMQKPVKDRKHRSYPGTPVFYKGKVCGINSYEDSDAAGVNTPMTMIKLGQTELDYIQEKIDSVSLKDKIPPKAKLNCWGCVDNRGRWNGKPLFLPSDDDIRCAKCFTK